MKFILFLELNLDFVRGDEEKGGDLYILGFFRLKFFSPNKLKKLKIEFASQPKSFLHFRGFFHRRAEIRTFSEPGKNSKAYSLSGLD